MQGVDIFVESALLAYVEKGTNLFGNISQDVKVLIVVRDIRIYSLFFHNPLGHALYSVRQRSTKEIASSNVFGSSGSSPRFSKNIVRKDRT